MIQKYEKNNDSDYDQSSNSDTSDNTEAESEQNKSNNNNNNKMDNKNETVASIDISTISVRGCKDKNMYVSISKSKGAQKRIFAIFVKSFKVKSLDI